MMYAIACTKDPLMVPFDKQDGHQSLTKLLVIKFSKINFYEISDANVLKLDRFSGLNALYKQSTLCVVQVAQQVAVATQIAIETLCGNTFLPLHVSLLPFSQ